MNNVDTKKMIKVLFGKELSEIDEQRLMILSEGHPLLIRILFELIKDGSFSLDEILKLISYPNNMSLLAQFVKGDIDIPILSKSELDILQKIALLGEIDINLFSRWNDDPSCEQITNTLVKKGLLTLTANNHVFLRLSTSEEFDYDNFPLDTFLDLLRNIKEDILAGEEVDERYPLSIIHHIRKADSAVDFVVTFYENRYEKNEKNDYQFNEKLNEILKELGYLNMKADKIDRTTESVDRKTDIILEAYDEIYTITGQLSEVLRDNAEAIQKIDELIEIAKNPSKSTLQRVNTIIGFLGSIASITSLPNVQNGLNQLKSLFLLIMR